MRFYNEQDVLTAALGYIRRDWYIFPVIGKLPDLRSAPHWSLDSSNDPAQIAAWFAGTSGLGIGLDLARSKLAVVDGDYLDRLDIPKELLTGRPFRGNPARMSWLFGVNGHPVRQAGYPWGETKAAGGYVVLPPSPHPDGHVYEWLDDSDDVPDVPALLLAYLTVTAAKQGERNNVLNKTAYALGDVPGARDVLMQAAKAVGLPAHEARATIRSALQASPVTEDAEGAAAGRSMSMTRASDVRPLRARWLWEDRMPLAALSLLAGREGLGKSTVAYWLVAQITRGTLPGELHRQPKAVLVSATEDSWAHIIVPRLMAAGADLDLVYRIEVDVHDLGRVDLSLPHDVVAIGEAAESVGAGLLLLDPLMSHLSGKLDSHKDGEVRAALEPLVRVCERTGLSILGIAHFNKGEKSDPMNAVMGSRAFTALARSVTTVVKDPNDETERRRVLGTPKNNQGRTDLPLLPFRLVGVPVQCDDGLVLMSHVDWLPEEEGTVAGLMNAAGEDSSHKSFAGECALWMSDYLSESGGQADRKALFAAARAQGFTDDNMRRARAKLRIETSTTGTFPRTTVWSLPEARVQ